MAEEKQPAVDRYEENVRMLKELLIMSARYFHLLKLEKINILSLYPAREDDIVSIREFSTGFFYFVNPQPGPGGSYGGKNTPRKPYLLRAEELADKLKEFRKEVGPERLLKNFLYKIREPLSKYLIEKELSDLERKILAEARIKF